LEISASLYSFGLVVAGAMRPHTSDVHTNKSFESLIYIDRLHRKLNQRSYLARDQIAGVYILVVLLSSLCAGLSDRALALFATLATGWGTQEVEKGTLRGRLVAKPAPMSFSHGKFD
jgi:hypothetical protein